MRLYDVHYEGWISSSTAAYARLGRALVAHKVKLKSSYAIRPLSDRTTTVQLMIELDYRKAEQFSKDAKIENFVYRSPCYFYNGTIIPTYKSPEEELAAKHNG